MVAYWDERLAWKAEAGCGLLPDQEHGRSTWGAPAWLAFSPVSGAAAAGPNVRVMIAAWPLVHPLIAFGISTLATYATQLVALASIAALGEGTEVHYVSPLSLAVHLQGSQTFARWPSGPEMHLFQHDVCRL